MIFHITNIKDTDLKEYIDQQTMYSCADNGAFDSVVSEELSCYANNEENCMAIVDKDGVSLFLDILKSGKCYGRDIDKFIKVIESNYMDGFMMRN